MQTLRLDLIPAAGREMSSRSFPQRRTPAVPPLEQTEIFQVQTFESVAEDPKIFENMQVLSKPAAKVLSL